MFADRQNREGAGSGHHPDMADTDGRAIFPFGDFHFVGKAERSDFGIAIECGSHSGGCGRGEADRYGIVHPVDVIGDIFNNGPDFVGSCVDNGADLDGCRNPSVENNGSNHAVGA